MSEPPWTPVPGGVWLALRHFVEPYVGASFFVTGDPVPKGRPRIGNNGHAYTPKATKAAEKRVRAAFRDALPGWEAEPDRTYGCLIEFRTRGGSQVDLDNATKLVWDALNKTFWDDDIQVATSFLNIIRGGDTDPGVEVLLFAVANNGTAPTRLCECGTRYRGSHRYCQACEKRRATVNALLREDADEEAAALFDQQKRRAFSYITACSIGTNSTPSTARIAERLQVSEHRARTVLAGLIDDGCLAREGRKLRVVRPMGAVA